MFVAIGVGGDGVYGGSIDDAYGSTSINSDGGGGMAIEVN